MSKPFGELDASTVPVRHGFPNPKYARVAELMSSVPQYRALAQRIKSMSALHGTKDVSKLKRLCEGVGIKDELRALVERNRSIPDEQPVMGCAPFYDFLYGSFKHGQGIIDIGSGNCMKIKKFTGHLKITAVDPNLRNESKHVLREFTCTFSEFLLVEVVDRPLTSWMAFTSLTDEERAVVRQYDGLHLIPDHDVLLSEKIARDERGVMVVSTINGEFREARVTEVGYPVAPGYLLVPFFERADVSVRFGKLEKGDYLPKLNARPAGFYELNFKDLSPKYDGRFWELELFDEEAYLTARNGEYRKGTCKVKGHYVYHLEDMGEFFVLLRVVLHGGFVPPHCGDVLRKYVDAVKILLDGRPVLAPVVWQGSKFRGDVHMVCDWSEDVCGEWQVPVDGVISRIDYKDFYCKYQWTVDLRPRSFGLFRERVLELGFDLVVEGEVDCLAEYGMVRENAVVRLSWLRDRPDKEQETSIDTAVRFVDKPSLGEVEEGYFVA